MEIRLPATSYLFRTSGVAGYLLLLPIVSIALLVRLHSPAYITECLWYEDGTVYITESYELGARSLWMTDSGGYLFLFHRLIALFAKQFPLILTPYMFFIAWLISFTSIVWVVKTRGNQLGLDSLSVLLVIVAIACQPSQGEPWFNLNHANFFLGIALALYICMPVKRAESVPEVVFLILASLTGVFSIVMTAVLAIQLVVLRDFSARKATYIVVPICGIVQAIFVIASQRLQQTRFDRNLLDWLNAIATFLSFGTTSRVIYIAAGLFWTVVGIYVYKWITNKEVQADRILWLSPLFSLAAAAMMYFVGALAGMPEFSPVDMASRYFLIPYSLVFFVAFVCTSHRKMAQIALACLAGVVCAGEFRTVDGADRESSTGLLAHTNLQWTAFAKFQKVEPDLVIPINSPLPIYPPDAHVQIAKEVANAAVRGRLARKPIILDSHRSDVTVDPMRRGDSHSGAGGSPTLSFDIGNYCVTNRYLALEIDIWRARMGFAKVHWGHPGGFAAQNSLERFYPAGPVTMQFAFRRDIADSTIEFDPALGVKDSAIVRTLMQDANAPVDPKITVATVTPPGGQVEVKEARLFCLE